MPNERLSYREAGNSVSKISHHHRQIFIQAGEMFGKLYLDYPRTSLLLSYYVHMGMKFTDQSNPTKPNRLDAIFFFYSPRKSSLVV